MLQGECWQPAHFIAITTTIIGQGILSHIEDPGVMMLWTKTMVKQAVYTLHLSTSLVPMREARKWYWKEMKLCKLHVHVLSGETTCVLIRVIPRKENLWWYVLFFNCESLRLPLIKLHYCIQSPVDFCGVDVGVNDNHWRQVCNETRGDNCFEFWANQY